LANKIYMPPTFGYKHGARSLVVMPILFGTLTTTRGRRVPSLIRPGKAIISLRQLGPIRRGLWVLQVEKDGHAR